MPAGANGPEAVAVIGAVTGVAALLWNIWRSVRQGERLHVTVFVFQEEMPERSGPAAAVRIANVGTLPAYVTSVELTEHLPRSHRWPLRALSFRARQRWWIRWALHSRLATYWRVPTDPPLVGRLDAGEARQGRLVDIINDKPEPMDENKIDRLLRERQWAVADTGLRQYAGRIVDNRPQ
jgi:hypothetical protein